MPDAKEQTMENTGRKREKGKVKIDERVYRHEKNNGFLNFAFFPSISDE
jgi:hypothetical protein